jgi:hypothetical protein
MMKRVIVLTLGFFVVGLAVATAVMASSGNAGFNATVHAIESRYHAHATRIPMMGFASAVARMSTKGGVGNINVVTFENFKGPVDGAEFNALVEEKLGKNWKRMIRETHPQSNEQTLIYARPEGNRMGLVVIDLDGNELDLVTVSVDPKYLHEEISKYTHTSHATVSSHADESEGADESKEMMGQQTVSTGTSE